MSSTGRRSATRMISCAAFLPGLLALASAALAGDPLGVNAALGGIQGNWPQAQFTIDVTGITDSTALVDHPLQVEYEAAARGYLTCLRVSSHGDILACGETPAALTDSGTLPLPVAAPLGHEQAIFLFSDRPLTDLPGVGGRAVSLGDDRAHADSLVEQIRQLQSQGVMVAARRVDYQVEAPAGQTQYTTRGIVRTIAASESTPSGPAAAPRFPARIEFEFDSDRLTQAGTRDLDVFGEAILQTMKDRRVRLEGHTDAIGPDRYNLGLSVRRAVAAQRYLTKSFGLPAGQITVTGKGKAGPIAPNTTEAGRSQNRRVDFVFAREPAAP